MKRMGLADFLSNHVNRNKIFIFPSQKTIYLCPGETIGKGLGTIGLKEIPDIIERKRDKKIFKNFLKFLSLEEINSYFIFASIRNPWDRLLAICVKFKIPFKEFVKNIENYELETEGQTRSLKENLCPLYFHTHLNGFPFINKIVKFENLPNDMKDVFKKMGLPQKKLPRLKNSLYPFYRKVYTQEEVEVVRSFYKKDIELFDYEF